MLQRASIGPYCSDARAQTATWFAIPVYIYVRSKGGVPDGSSDVQVRDSVYLSIDKMQRDRWRAYRHPCRKQCREFYRSPRSIGFFQQINLFTNPIFDRSCNEIDKVVRTCSTSAKATRHSNAEIISGANNASHPWAANTDTHAQTLPRLFRPAVRYRRQLLCLQVEHQRLHYKVGSRLLLGSRPQHRTSYDIGGGVQVSVHELHVCIDAG